MPGEIELRRGAAAKSGQAFLWTKIREIGAAGRAFSIDELHGHTNCPRSSVAEYVWRLEKGGFLRRKGTLPGAVAHRSRTAFVVARELKAAPQVDPSGQVRPGRRGARQALWNVLRGPMARSGISVTDLAAYASTDELPVSRPAARSYLKILVGAGYLVSVRRGVWRLKPSMNTGPLPPRDLGAGSVYDQNRKVKIGGKS